MTKPAPNLNSFGCGHNSSWKGTDLSGDLFLKMNSKTGFALFLIIVKICVGSSRLENTANQQKTTAVSGKKNQTHTKLAREFLSRMDNMSQPDSTGYLSKVWTPDLPGRMYKNPILYADYSDPDVIRVGSDFYMTASSFSCFPKPNYYRNDNRKD